MGQRKKQWWPDGVFETQEERIQRLNAIPNKKPPPRGPRRPPGERSYAPKVSFNRNGVRLLTAHDSPLAVDLLSCLEPDSAVISAPGEVVAGQYQGPVTNTNGGHKSRRPAGWQPEGLYDARHLEESPDEFRRSGVDQAIRDRAARHNLSVPVEIYGPSCQHPQIRRAGSCGRDSIGVFEIPDDYIPPRRHSTTPLIPRPHSRLCRQHYSIVSAWARGARLAGNSHESWCPVCQHPARNQVLDLWLQWRINTDQAVLELGVTHRSFYNHVQYFNLNGRKTDKENIMHALVGAAERGFAAGGDDIKSGLKAAELLAKHSDWAAARKVEVDVKGKLEVTATSADFSKMSDAELADHFEGLARQLRQAGGVVKQLPDPSSQVIDLPKANVRELVTASTVGDTEE